MLIKKLFGALIILATLTFSQNVHAAQSDWVAQNFDFRNIKSVIILDAAVNPNLDYGGIIGLRGLQNTFRNSCRQELYTTLQVFSEDEARVVIGKEIGVNLERLFLEDPIKARQLVMENAWRMADAYILGIIDSWGNKTYTAPTNVEYAELMEKRNYHDAQGNVHPDNVLVPVPEKYLPEGTDVPAIGMILRAYAAKNETIIFERYEMRIRKTDESQTALFGNMSADFAAAFAAKIQDKN